MARTNGNGNGSGADLWVQLLSRLDKVGKDLSSAKAGIQSVARVVSKLATLSRRKFAELERRIESLEARR